MIEMGIVPKRMRPRMCRTLMEIEMKLSPARERVPVLEGIELLNRGKVRDSYALNDGKMLVVATDAISIFDIVLNALVPEKGVILNAMSHFWLTDIEATLHVRTHLMAAGAAIDEHVPVHLWGNPQLQARAMVVRRLKMTDVEFIGRGYLTGSGLKSYNETGLVCGHHLSPGLQDGDQLPAMIATPTTKAQEGHDEALNAAAIRERYPEETRLLLEIYGVVHDVAHRNGIVLADTKLEFGRDEAGKVILAD